MFELSLTIKGLGYNRIQAVLRSYPECISTFFQKNNWVRNLEVSSSISSTILSN